MTAAPPPAGPYSRGLIEVKRQATSRGTPEETTKTNVKLDYFPQSDIVALLRLSGPGNGKGADRSSNGKDKLFHQNWVPTLNEKNFVSSPSCVRIALAMSMRSGPNGDTQFTPTPIESRGFGESPR